MVVTVCYCCLLTLVKKIIDSKLLYAAHLSAIECSMEELQLFYIEGKQERNGFSIFFCVCKAKRLIIYHI